MISLIIGNKGSGKTKRLISLVDEAMEKTNGCVVCIEKEPLLTYQVNYRVRLIDTDHFGINGYDQFFGFICGVCAGNHDITDILVDATLKNGGKDYEQLASFLEKVNAVTKESDTKITFTVSADKADLPQRIFDFCQVID